MIRVLVVDDDFMVAKVHSGYVNKTDGFSVVGVAHSGNDAIAAAQELVPDLILLDIYLPDIDGLAVLRDLRAESATADIDVIVITAARDVSTIRGAMRGGAVHYLIKPFSYPALRDQLEHVGSLRAKLASLSTGGTAAQQDVDEVFSARPPSSNPLPKGLTAQTAALVKQALMTHSNGLSASECATVTELSRPSARRYLEHFVAVGDADVRLRYGGAGRPERQYHWRNR